MLHSSWHIERGIVNVLFSILRRAAFENRTEERSFQVFKKTLARWQPGFVIDCFQKRSDSRRRSETKGRRHNGNSEADRRVITHHSFQSCTLLSRPMKTWMGGISAATGEGDLQMYANQGASSRRTKDQINTGGTRRHLLAGSHRSTELGILIKGNFKTDLCS